MNKYLARPYYLLRRKRQFRNYFETCASRATAPRLHVGCGNRPIAGWCNVDVASLSDEVQYADALNALPFEPGTFQYVYSEHFIEHLPFEDGLRFFKEAHRVLKPGGILRTATPDLKFLLSLYDSSTSGGKRYMDYVAQNFDGNKPTSAVACVNRAFYGWGHRFIYDAQFLEQVLSKVGYGGFRHFKPGKSDVAELRDLEQHGKSVPSDINDLETFVLEAVKQ